jgi:carbamoyl-phosphate synthase large subunit
VNVLISAAGRRGALVRLWQADLRSVDPDGRVVAVDASRLSAAARLADAAEVVPYTDDPAFLPALLDVCKRHDIGLIVPTHDGEGPAYVRHREALEAAGVVLSLPGDEAISVALDKVRTDEWLRAHDIPTVATAPLQVALDDRDAWPLPLVVKPARGSSGEGVSFARTEADLRWRAREEHWSLIAQEPAGGVEFTADAWADRSGTCRCVVPRRRIEVRAGEVSKSLTVRWPEAEALVARLVTALPGAFGCVTVQFFAQDRDASSIQVIEINTRYGGGYPLSWEAGARYPLWTLQELLGLPSTAAPDRWRDGLAMLRYDDAVFVDGAEVGL